MGNHTKIVLKKLVTADGEYELKKNDLIIELIPNSKDVCIEGITPRFILNQVCLVKTFEIHEFDDNIVILWQVAEGIISLRKTWRFGCDNKVIGDMIYNSMCDKFLSKALKTKRSLFVIVSTESKKLLYKEVLISE